MSDKTWKKLSPDQQKAVKEAADEATKYENKLVFEKTQEIFKELQAKGMKVTQPDTTEWAKAARTTHQQFAEKNGPEIYAKIIEAGKQ